MHRQLVHFCFEGHNKKERWGNQKRSEWNNFHPILVGSGGWRGRVLKEEPPRIRGWGEFSTEATFETLSKFNFCSISFKQDFQGLCNWVVLQNKNRNQVRISGSCYCHPVICKTLRWQIGQNHAHYDRNHLGISPSSSFSPECLTWPAGDISPWATWQQSPPPCHHHPSRRQTGKSGLRISKGHSVAQQKFLHRITKRTVIT